MNKSTENRQLMINGELVHDRILRRLPELTKAVIASILEQVSFYRQLPDEEIAGDIVRVIQENLRMFAGLMRDRRLPDAAELSGFGESAMRRAEEGVPLGWCWTPTTSPRTMPGK